MLPSGSIRRVMYLDSVKKRPGKVTEVTRRQLESKASRIKAELRDLRMGGEWGTEADIHDRNAILRTSGAP